MPTPSMLKSNRGMVNSYGQEMGEPGMNQTYYEYPGYGDGRRQWKWFWFDLINYIYEWYKLFWNVWEIAFSMGMDIPEWVYRTKNTTIFSICIK